MARYIDADVLKKRLGEIGYEADDLYAMGINRGLDRAETAVDMIPTADVVPKSEVEELITLNSQLEATIFGQREEIKKLEKALRKSLPSYCQVISEEKAIELGKEYGRREVAREIFAAIENAWSTTYYESEFEERLAELEKKYTEGSDG